MPASRPPADAISIVVAAHNVAPYIERCLASLLSQTMPVEIVVVDDGSTDHTADVVRRIADSSVHAVHLFQQSHSGLSAARNEGIRRVHGQFIGFVDGDDWVEADAYETLFEEARLHSADLVLFSGQFVHDQTQALSPFRDAQRFDELSRRQTAVFESRSEPDVFRLDTSACRRLYRRNILTAMEHPFAPGALFEDVLLHFQLLVAPTRLLLVNRMFYNYRIGRPGRITDRSDASILSVFEMLDRSQQVLRQGSVTPSIWASYIWVQSWVLRWLASQVDPGLQSTFLNCVVKSGRRVPRAGITEFQRRFRDDRIAQLTVALQLFGFKESFLRLATDTESPHDTGLFAVASHLGPVARYLARVS